MSKLTGTTRPYPPLTIREVEDLMRFYEVNTEAGLIAAQNQHVESLLNRLAQFKQSAPKWAEYGRSPREG